MKKKAKITDEGKNEINNWIIEVKGNNSRFSKANGKSLK
jgi:hypothetical protein